jgi:hypothetical protein
MKILTKDIRSPSQNSKPGPPEKESGGANHYTVMFGCSIRIICEAVL